MVCGFDAYFDEAGLSPAAARRNCFRFDIAVALLGDTIDRRREETVLKPAPKRAKRPMVPVAKYKTLSALLNEDIFATPTAPDPEQDAAAAELKDAWEGDPSRFMELLTGHDDLAAFLMENEPDA